MTQIKKRKLGTKSKCITFYPRSNMHVQRNTYLHLICFIITAVFIVLVALVDIAPDRLHRRHIWLGQRNVPVVPLLHTLKQADDPLVREFERLGGAVELPARHQRTSLVGVQALPHSHRAFADDGVGQPQSGGHRARTSVACVLGIDV